MVAVPQPPDASIVSRSNGPPPVMLHYAINRPVGATRGESDLAPILKWALRYNAWLEDRVRLNRIRTRQGVLDVKIADDTQVESKKYQLRRDDPMDAGIYITAPARRPRFTRCRSARRMPKRTAAPFAWPSRPAATPHYTTWAKERRSTLPPPRRWESPQPLLCRAPTRPDQPHHYPNLNRSRTLLVGHRPQATRGGDLRLNISAPEVARADNLALAQAFADATAALANLRAEGWIDDDTAIRLAFKFAGETVTDEQIATILSQSKDHRTADRGRDPAYSTRLGLPIAPTQEAP